MAKGRKLLFRGTCIKLKINKRREKKNQINKKTTFLVFINCKKEKEKKEREKKKNNYQFLKQDKKIFGVV